MNHLKNCRSSTVIKSILIWSESVFTDINRFIHLSFRLVEATRARNSMKTNIVLELEQLSVSNQCGTPMECRGAAMVESPMK